MSAVPGKGCKRWTIALVVLASAALLVAPPEPTESGLSRSLGNELGFPRSYHLWGSARNPDELARYDLVVGYGYWDVRSLRRSNPQGIFLLTPGLRPAQPRSYGGLAMTYGALSEWRGGVDRLVGGPRLGRIRAFDARWDLLYEANGSVALVNDEWRHPGWNLADPLRKGTPALVAKVVAHASKRAGLYRAGWDGIHLDNWIYRIGVSWFYGANLDTDRDGEVDDYESLRRDWARGLTRAGLLLRRYLPGKVVGGNGNWNVGTGLGGVDFRRFLGRSDDHLRSANYTLIEALELYADRADEILASAREWLSHQDPLGLPRHLAMLHRLSAADDYRAARWGMSLATIAGAYYGVWVASHDDRLWFDELDGGVGGRGRHWLGLPLGEPVRDRSGAWVRAFEHGLVLNNSTSEPVTVELGEAYARLRGRQDPVVNDGSSVTSVTIAAHDGLFLRRVG